MWVFTSRFLHNENKEVKIMSRTKQANKNTQVLICNQLTDSELIRGKNGIVIFDEWHRPEEYDNCSRGDIARACRLGRGF